MQDIQNDCIHNMGQSIIYHVNIAYYLLWDFTKTWLSGGTLMLCDPSSDCWQLDCHLVQVETW